MKAYVINHNPASKEIHRRDHLTDNCQIREIKDKEETDDYNKVYRLLKPRGSYNGCYYCYRNQHTD
ncbi:hypothetical protein J2S78_002076 [Salibacterium salarium]|uniref:hypothetical protein n=1 Tax=Salibacterium salarium TaxID=284579 RepID=UPI00278470BE|nr:hypothetical protein [Salibacterium salarium]MDQ0299656.1 hypothetical protein [Salibacterium salarium]